MRLFIFAIFLGAFVGVAPQNEERTRPRGLRRFSLSSPALRAPHTTEDKGGANELIEENHATPSEPRTRSRGTNLLRRGRPALRIRGRVNDEAQEATAPLPSHNTDIKNVVPEAAEGKRGGLRIRRPVKKIVVSTTSTTTTTESPVAEEIATEPIPEERQSLTVNEHMKEKAGEGMLTEESNAVVKDEVMQNEEQKLMSEKMENLPVEEKPMQKEVIPEQKAEKQPQMKKLRPIPIKIRRRGKGGKPQPEELPKEMINPEPEQAASADPNPVSSHRFSPRPRPRIQARRRPVNRESTRAETQQEAVGPAAAAAEENVPSESANRQQSRGDVPSLRKRPSRISTRQRTTEVQENKPERTAVEETALPEFQPETRTTRINELKKPLKEAAGIDGSVKKRVRIRTRVQKPSTTDEDKENQVTNEQNEATLDSVLGAPISESVKAGRPIKIKEVVEREQVSRQGQPEIRSKFPIPNYGGSDLIFKGGDVQVTQIGTIEDSPTEEVLKILSGFGSRRRGLARPRNSQSNDEAKSRTNMQVNSQLDEKLAEDSLTASSNHDLNSNVDFIYDYYEY